MGTRAWRGSTRLRPHGPADTIVRPCMDIYAGIARGWGIRPPLSPIPQPVDLRAGPTPARGPPRRAATPPAGRADHRAAPGGRQRGYQGRPPDRRARPRPRPHRGHRARRRAHPDRHQRRRRPATIRRTTHLPVRSWKAQHPRRARESDTVVVKRGGHLRSGGAGSGPAPPASTVLRIATRPPPVAVDPGASTDPAAGSPPSRPQPCPPARAARAPAQRPAPQPLRFLARTSTITRDRNVKHQVGPDRRSIGAIATSVRVVRSGAGLL